MSSKKSQKITNILSVCPLQVTSYDVTAHIPAGDKTAFSQENTVLRFIEQAFGDPLSLTNLLKKIERKIIFPRYWNNLRLGFEFSMLSWTNTNLAKLFDVLFAINSPSRTSIRTE